MNPESESYITSKQLMLPVWFSIYIMWHQDNRKIILHWNLLRSYMYMYKKCITQ